MTDIRKDMEKPAKRRSTGKKKALLAFSVSLIGCLAVWLYVSDTKKPDDTRQETVSRENPALVPRHDPLERFNEELRSPEHPLRKLVEGELGISVPDRTVKRRELGLDARDPDGETLSVRWDEFHYEPWGGFFFQGVRHATIRSVFHEGQWSIVSCEDDQTARLLDGKPGEPMPPESGCRVFIRIWNDESQCFSEFDESVCCFDSDRKNVVLIHGMGGSTRTDWIRKMAQRIRQHEPETNILGLDWSFMQKKEGRDESDRPSGTWEQTKDRLARPLDLLLMPKETADRIPDVVRQADSHLFGKDSLNLKPSKTHLIGFSHGCHIAGMLGMKHPDDRIDRLTVLDPSTRLVHLNPDNRLGTGWGRSAAGFIDMYASSKWAGSGKIYGHKTFFVMEKNEKPVWQNPKKWEMFNTVADHMYAAKWFLSTIGNNDPRFGYSINREQGEDTTWSETIRSTLPKQGEFEGIDDEIVNELVGGD